MNSFSARPALDVLSLDGLGRYPDITAQRVLEILKDEGFEGGYAGVKESTCHSGAYACPRSRHRVSRRARVRAGGDGRERLVAVRPWTYATAAPGADVQLTLYVLVYSKRKCFGVFGSADLFAHVDGHDARLRCSRRPALSGANTTARSPSCSDGRALCIYSPGVPRLRRALRDPARRRAREITPSRVSSGAAGNTGGRSSNGRCCTESRRLRGATRRLARAHRRSATPCSQTATSIGFATRRPTSSASWPMRYGRMRDEGELLVLPGDDHQAVARSHSCRHGHPCC